MHKENEILVQCDFINDSQATFIYHQIIISAKMCLYIMKRSDIKSPKVTSGGDICLSSTKPSKYEENVKYMCYLSLKNTILLSYFRVKY